MFKNASKRFKSLLISVTLFGGFLVFTPLIAMSFLFEDFTYRFGWYFTAYLLIAVPPLLGCSIIANAWSAFVVSKRAAAE